MTYLWAALGLICVALAIVGVVLPLLPTVPFLLLAAFFFARSSSRLHHWLLSHPNFGPLITDWNQSGTIRPRAKRLATLSIAIVPVISAIIGISNYIIIIQIVTLGLVLIFIWTRPNG